METTNHPDPESLHPHLTPSRLLAIAILEAEVRKGVAEATSNDRGDTKWSRACLALDRRIKRFSDAAMLEYPEWLSIQDSSRHFVIRAGDVPLRIYTVGVEETAPERYVRQFPDELRAIQAAFPFNGAHPDDEDLILRLAVSLDPGYCVGEMRLVRLNKDGKVLEGWNIPLDGEGLAGSIGRRSVPKPPPVDLGEPVVGPVDDAADSRGA